MNKHSCRTLLCSRCLVSISIVFIFCVLFVGPSTVNAQTDWVVGIKGGFNSQKADLSTTLGAFAGKVFSDRLGIRVEALFTEDYFGTPLLITVNTTEGEHATLHFDAGIVPLFALSGGDRSTDFGGIIGIGINRPTGSVEIVADARLMLAFTDTLDSFGDSVFSLMVGVGVPLPLK